MNLIVSEQAVRDYLELNSPGSTSRYTSGTIGSNIRAAQQFLEHNCHRFFYDHPAATWSRTTMLAAQVSIPGFRTFTSVTWGGASITVNLPGQTGGGAWALPEETPGATDNPLFTALQFRAWRADHDIPWWLVLGGPRTNWFDTAADNPFDPRNYAGGWAWTSLPNDLVITGDGGYAAGTEPDAVLHAVKVLAAFYTMRPSSILADVAITPSGGVLNYSQMPAEVRDFIADWKLGQQVAGL